MLTCFGCVTCFGTWVCVRCRGDKERAGWVLSLELARSTEPVSFPLFYCRAASLPRFRFVGFVSCFLVCYSVGRPACFIGLIPDYSTINYFFVAGQQNVQEEYQWKTIYFSREKKGINCLNY